MVGVKGLDGGRVGVGVKGVGSGGGQRKVG